MTEIKHSLREIYHFLPMCIAAVRQIQLEIVSQCSASLSRQTTYSKRSGYQGNNLEHNNHKYP